MVALEAAFDHVMDWLEDEVMDRLLGPETMAGDLAAIGGGLERVLSNTRGARAFSEAPLLSGAIDAAMDLVAGVYALPQSQPGRTHLDCGQQELIRPRRSSSPTVTRSSIGVQVNDNKWQVRLQFAICAVQNAVRVHCLCRHPRLLMKEAWWNVYFITIFTNGLVERSA
uniref:Uncharacterized protein n=1 Tax=Oryza barthii TaxID=65489 RepID=A0A0D3FIV1_9ORYZ